MSTRDPLQRGNDLDGTTSSAYDAYPFILEVNAVEKSMNGNHKNPFSLTYHPRPPNA
jgi:hypothetical protein